MSSLGVVRWPERGTEAFKILKRLEDMLPQEKVDMECPRDCAFVPVTGSSDAKAVSKKWHGIVHQYTMSFIGTKLIRWPNGDCELLIWRKT
jgi:hypothetical protein